MFDYYSVCFPDVQPGGEDDRNSRALGGALKLTGYTTHPQNRASLLLGLVPQKYRIRIFTGIHVGLLRGGVGREHIECRCGNLSQCRTLTSLRE
jgi:hypothetical protein